jgi:antitoxin ParD1/3/4
MTQISKRTISLPAEHSAFIDEKVRSGAYASVSEVVRAGLRSLQERDEAVERWLSGEVAGTYDAMKANPSRGINAAEAFAQVRNRRNSK